VPGDVIIPSFQWRPFCVALVAVAGLTSIAWLASPPVYVTNDDVAIKLAVEGRVVPGQPPSGFVLITTSLLAWSIVGLYRLLPVIPWWDLVVSATTVCALSVFFSIGWSTLGRGWLARATGSGVLLMVAIPLLSGLQFTIAATLAGGAAALAAVLEVSSTAYARRSVLVMSAALLVVGLLVRPMGAAAGVLAVVVCLIPLALVRALPIKTFAIALVTTAGLCVAVLSLDVLPYKLDRNWDDYRRYQSMVVGLLEWGGDVSATEAEAIRQAVGWSSNDWAMIRWFAVDPLVHGIPQMAKAYDTRSATTGWGSMVRPSWFDAVRIERGLRGVLANSAVALSGLAAVLLAYGTRRGILVAAMIVVAFGALCVATETVFKELPFRVLAPIQMCMAAAAIVAAGALKRESRHPRMVLGLAIVVALLTFQIPATLKAASDEHRHSQQVDGEVQAMVQRLAPSLIVLHADSFPSEHWWRPFHRTPIDLPAIALGWNNQNPLLQTFLSVSGRQPLLRAMCTDPSILVVAEEGRLDFVTIYLREHFNESVIWSRMMEGSFSFPVWRCSPARRSIPPGATEPDVLPS